MSVLVCATNVLRKVPGAIYAQHIAMYENYFYKKRDNDFYPS